LKIFNREPYKRKLNMEAILWESGARGIDELEELRMEQEEAVTMRRGGSVAGSSPTPGLEETIVE